MHTKLIQTSMSIGHDCNLSHTWASSRQLCGPNEFHQQRKTKGVLMLLQIQSAADSPQVPFPSEKQLLPAKQLQLTRMWAHGKLAPCLREK